MRILLTIIFLSSSTLLAQIQNSTRPGQSDPDLPVGKGGLQFEGGLQFQRSKEVFPGFVSSVEQITLDFLGPLAYLRYGFADRFEVNAGISGEYHSTISKDVTFQDKFQSSRLSQPNIALHAALVREHVWLPKTGLLLRTIFPIDRDLYGDAWMNQLKLTWSKDLNVLTIGGNINSELNWNIEKYYFSGFTFWLTKSFGNISPFIELFAFNGYQEDLDFSMDGGINILVNENLQIDIHGGGSFQSNSWFASTGVVWLIRAPSHQAEKE